MSQLNVDTLKDRTGADQPDIVGAAKAWVNFNGTGTLAIRDSFNVASVTDNGVGDYIVFIDNDFPDTNYSALACGGNNGATYADLANVATSGRLVGSFRIRCLNVNTGSLIDIQEVSAAAFGN